jgi:HEAT repeat protein
MSAHASLVSSDIAKMKVRRDIPGLISAFYDPSDDIRNSAAQALGTIGGSTVLYILLLKLKDTDEKVRKAASDSMIFLKDIRSVGFLIDMIDDKENETSLLVKNTLQTLLPKFTYEHIKNSYIENPNFSDSKRIKLFQIIENLSDPEFLIGIMDSYAFKEWLKQERNQFSL